jgi:hypothetical protein
MLWTRAGLAAAAVAAVAAILPAASFADSDPASDILPTQNVFLPYQPKVSPALARDLTGVTAAAAKAGYPIKVAIVATSADLGGAVSVFNQPARYAGFLGQEISFNNKQQPLLVVMPVGLGTFRAGPRAPAAIARLKVGSGVDGMARTALDAVQKLAAAAGHPIRGFKPASASGGSGGGSTALIFAVPIALLVLVFAVISYRRAGEDDEAEAEQDEVQA